MVTVFAQRSLRRTLRVLRAVAPFAIARCVLQTAALAAVVAACGAPAQAQESVASSTYVTPFPSNDVYQLQVVGDSLSDGLHWMFRDALSVDARVNVRRQRWAFNSLMSSRFSRELSAMKRDLRAARIDIAVVLIGTYDDRAVRDDAGRWQKIGTPGWREELSRRVDAMMRVLRDLKIAVYWVGLPTMRKGKSNEAALVINEVVRERAYLRQIRYIDVFTSFADERGGYSAYGPDITGKIRLLRERDGVHLTKEGYRKLAHFVERELKRDLKQAKAERSIPLAGAPKEQARIGPKADDEEGVKPDSGWRAAIGVAKPGGTTQSAPEAGGFFSSARGGEQKSDNGKITLRSFDNTGQEETVTLEIVRPAIPASVVALVTRKQSPDRLSRVGDTVVDHIAGGLSIMSSVTPAQETLGGRGRSGLSPAQTPFFRVLVKGERTAAKPGRADDFSWPRPKPPPLPKPVKHVPRTADPDDGGIPLPPRSPFRRPA